jgi:hypothetical protein
MKTVIRNILIGTALLVSTGQVYAYPPDNAAVLYYKSFILLHEPNDTVIKMLNDLQNGKIGLNDQIEQYVESNRNVIKEVVKAAEIKNCDWGLDLSEGFGTLLPHLAKCKEIANLLAADAKILAEKGYYKTALERCITIHNLGIHVGNETLISCLVSRAITKIANSSIVEILSRGSENYETLEQLKAQIGDIFNRCPSMKETIGSEIKCWSDNINEKDMLELIHNSGLPRDELEKLDLFIKEHSAKEFYTRTRDYYRGVLGKLQIAYDLPFVDAKQAFDNVYKEVENAAKDKPEAVIVKAMLPAKNQVLIKDTGVKTYFNAVLAGLDIYLIKAKTGKLPDELPVGLPKDLFSGKDFLYEKTDTGFTLTGQGKDLDKDIIQKYEFKVAK